ncbi:hypothetical protein AB0B45_43375 [Nonomuraea sp. NPDC049152]
MPFATAHPVNVLHNRTPRELLSDSGGPSKEIARLVGQSEIFI